MERLLPENHFETYRSRMRSIFVLLMFFTFHGPNVKAVQSSMADTLIIKTQKKMGFDLFVEFASGGRIMFNDTVNNSALKYPKDISDIKVAFEIVDRKLEYFKRYKAGHFDTIQFKKWAYEKKIDTLNIPSELDNSICIMKGNKGGKKIFIIDSNNNKDFRDDSIRYYNKNAFETISKVKYRIFNGLKLIEDSGWCATPSFDGEELDFFVAQHLNSSINIGGNIYQIGLIGKRDSEFAFDIPVVSLVSENNSTKEKLMTKDFIEKGEYLKLGKDYYRFADISNDGKYVTLIKEANFENKIGTQMGMIAPGFQIRTTDKIIINSKSKRDNLLLLANISACNPESYENFNKMVSSSKMVSSNKPTIRVIGIEHILSKKMNATMVDTNDSFNQDFYKIYRKEETDYNCYLIDTRGRIIEKFSIYEWASVLQDY